MWTEPPDRAPSHVTMGLLDNITAHSMDGDYQQVALRRSALGEPRPARSGLAVLVIVATFGILVATAGVQTSRNASVSSDARESLIKQIQQRQLQLDDRRARVSEVRAEINALRSSYLETTAEGRILQSRLSRLGISAGTAAVRGPGVRVTVDDSPNATSNRQRVLDKDLRRLVNGLWQAGAEAIAINGQRLTTQSAIRVGGSAITVNYVSLARPYVVSAIGNPNQTEARFAETAAGAYWLDVQRIWGLQFAITSEEYLKLPAAKRPVLRYAHLPGGQS